MEIKTKSDKWLKQIWEILSEEEFKAFSLWMKVERYIQEKILEFSNNLNIMASDYDFRSELIIFPIRGKILAMCFGNYELKRIVGFQEYLSDYHYQNQTDRPKEISKKEWNQRMRDWDRALGWDAPSERGMLIELLNTRELSFLIKKCSGESKQLELKIPDDETRISKIVDTFKDYPNPQKQQLAITNGLSI